MKIIFKDQPKLYSPNPALDAFFKIPPYTPEALELARDQLEGRHFPRVELSDILYQYNIEIGNDALALEQVERLSATDSTCVITGQQVGVMGGPTYTILKAISCLLLARQANAIPIFWLASEDHDVAEIDHTYLIDSLGNLQKYHLSLPKDGRPVEDLILSPSCVEVINAFLATVNIPSLTQEILPGASYAKTMARFMARLFAGTGLVFLEPYLLRQLAVPFFISEIQNSEAIAGVLQKSTQSLEAAGGKALVPISQGTNLFMKTIEGYRRKIQYTESGFAVGSKNYTEEQLVSLIENEPQRFSPNVLARPVMQNLLFPTLAYVAGPSELRYYHQLRDYHEFHEAPMPWVFPRVSATFISPYVADLLEKCHLVPWNPIPKNWYDLMPDLDMGLENMMEDWHHLALIYFKEDLDPHTIERLVRQATLKVQRRVYKARLKRQGLPYHALHLLRNHLLPHGKLQERVLNWYGIQADSGENLIHSLLQQIDWQQGGHSYCTLPKGSCDITL